KTKDLMDGKIDMMTAAQEVALDFIGFMICFAIGLLFVFIFPIVALCFCCCRCCGNCGGKRLQKHDDNAKCKRYVFSAILFVLAMFVVAGAACTFVTSDQVSKNLGGLNDSFSDSVDDVQAFVDNIHSVSRLHDASTEISERLITEINAIVNLDEPLDKISTLSDQAVVQIDDLEATTATAKGQRDSAVASLRPISAGCPVTNCIDPEITTLENLPFDDMETKLRNFRDKVTTDVFDSLKTELDGNIEAEVKKATDNIEVGTEMDKIYNDQIKPMLDQVDKLKTNMASDMDSYKDMVDSFTSLAEPYDKYRWYAGVGLASFLMLIAVLMLFGIVLGILCGSANAKPTERGAASNCGGIMLMAAVGLIFIFGAFLMLLTTLMYMLGSLTERYVCQTFDDLSKVEEYTSSLNMGMDLKNISFDLNGDTISTGISKDLNLLENLNMSQTVQEASATIDVSAAVNDLKATTAALGDLKTSLRNGWLVTKPVIMNGEHRGTATRRTEADHWNNNIRVQPTDLLLSAQGTDPCSTVAITTLKTQVINARDGIDAENTGTPNDGTTYLSPLIATLVEMETTATNLQGTSQAITDEAAVVETRVNDTNTKLGDTALMTDLVNSTTQDLVNTLFDYVESYVGDVKTKLGSDVAKCGPVYSIFNAIVSEAMCHGIVDPLNGFWLAIGWCIFFFMPGLIFAVKLAKHFRRMLYEDSYGSPTTEAEAPPPYSTEASAGKG
ncbi:hypothetical protein BaRGS_00029607, partial [Batillaria attramentaria]